MAVEARWVTFGEGAIAALAAEIARGKQDDPLAPVTVITPSPAVAVASRRALARRLGALAGASFHSLGALAELIAAPRIAAHGIQVGVDRELLVTAVRVALAEDPGTLGPIAHHRATWEAVAATIADLDVHATGHDDGDDDGHDVVDPGGPPVGGLAAEMLRLRGRVNAIVGPHGDGAVFDAAVEQVRSGGADVDAIGPVVVHLPEQLPRRGVDLLVALADATDVTVLVGLSGDAEADASLAKHLSSLGVPPPPVDGTPSIGATEIVSANDIDDEVRAALRRLFALADAGTPVHRLAIVHPPGAPYAQIVRDVLAATGVPSSGPSTQRLSQTVAGRVLLGVLDVAATGFGRRAVIDLWALGVVVDAEGRPVPFAAFDELSRRFGVTGGLDRWREVTALARARDERRLVPGDATPGDDDLDPTADRLAVALADLDALCADLPSSWEEVVGWAAAALDRLCGPVSRRSAWPDHEIDADAAIRTALGRLGSLAGVEPRPTRALLHDTVATVLDTPAPRPGQNGVGLVVATHDQPPVIPLEGVAVVGLVEGHAPRLSGDDVLLGDELRARLGMPTADDLRRAHRRSFRAAVHSAATTRILTFSRHDQRSGRALVPSRWLVDAVHECTGERPDTERLMQGRPVRGVDVVASHRAGLLDVAAERTVALHADDRALAELVAVGGLDHPAAADPVIEAGSALLRGRTALGFTRFDGNLDGRGVDVTAGRLLSPTSLEIYAQCPRRWFFRHGLGLHTVDRPEEIDRIQPADRGSLVHRILERFFREQIEAGTVPAPGVPWADAARQRLVQITDDEAAVLASRGLTGHPRIWEHDRSEIHAVVQQALLGDEAVRAELDTMPVAVEFSFGTDGQPPLRVDLGDGRSIELAGKADRVDAGAGSRVVWDYKYASTTPYETLDKPDEAGGDPLAGGTKLQLVTYALAVGDHAAVEPVSAYYWFLKPPTVNKRIGYGLDDGLHARFRRTVRTLVDGIGEGRFPARPGEYRWHRGNFDHCAWCQFDTICPRDRDEEWERVRLHPTLERLVHLAEEGTR